MYTRKQKLVTMRHRISVFLGWIVLLFISCSDDAAFTLDGQLQNAGNVNTVVFYEGERKLDSVFLNERGEFRFRRAASHPRLLTLEAGNNRYHLILQNGDRVSFSADLARADGRYEVTGSPLSDKIKEFSATIAEKERSEVALEERFAKEAARLDDKAIMNLRQEYVQKYRQGMRDYTDKAVHFAEEHDDLAGFFAMSTLDPELAEAELIAYADRITGRWDDNARVRQFLDEITKLKRLAIGQPAPEFQSLTPDNKPVKLSDFKGKYTLVDFWASWCVPCREENPNIVRQYRNFKDKGFTVLGVSLDGNPGSWLKAIREDGLEWTQVSDLQQWGSEVVGLYRIQAIPTSYLLDPNGVIIAKNLRGAELETFLKKTFD